jgi:hypothetical protein
MGFELTDGRAIVLLELLRLSLIAQTGLGCVLCIIGIRTAWQDLKWSQAGNGGKQIASAMRLQVEVLLLLVFALTLSLSLFFTVPLGQDDGGVGAPGSGGQSAGPSSTPICSCCSWSRW